MNRNTTQLLLTKGDNNPYDDFTLYKGIEYLERKHIIGKVRGYVLLSFKLKATLTGQVLTLRWIRYDCHGKLFPPGALHG